MKHDTKDHKSSFELREGEKLDDLERNGLYIIQDKERFCFGVDAVFLSGFVRLTKKSRCIDLGTGTGILPILLSAKTDCSSFVGVELQEESADMARRSVKGNSLEDKIEIVTLDLKKSASHFGKGGFDAVVTNPPYIEKGAGLLGDNEAKNIARTELKCTLKDVVEQASLLLRPAGTLFMIHRPQRLCEIICTLRDHGIEPKRMRFVQPKVTEAPNLVMIEGVKGARSGLIAEPALVIHESDGSYTQEIRENYGF